MSGCTASVLPPRVCPEHGICHTCGGTDTHAARTAIGDTVVCAACRRLKPRPERRDDDAGTAVQRILSSNPRPNPSYWHEPLRSELQRALAAEVV
jgi:hypothetical protein